jgi:hypothetical protein
MLKKLEGIADQVEVLRKLPAGTQKNSLQNAADQHDQRKQLAVLHTAQLLGGFRKCDADDPEIFVWSIKDVLARYDVDIQKQVVEPGRWKWPPRPYELREACEAIANERARARERQERITAQLEESRRLDAALATDRKPLTYQRRDDPLTKVEEKRREADEQKRREAEQTVARYKREAQASARPAAAPSVFDLDPADWNA